MQQYYGSAIYLVALAAFFYFFFVRPNQQRQREMQALLASLAVGDQVITAGGIYGTIRAIEEDIVDLEVADGVIVRIAKGAVARKLEE
jgi:preprotein translocase subunit YajC